MIKKYKSPRLLIRFAQLELVIQMGSEKYLESSDIRDKVLITTTTYGHDQMIRYSTQKIRPSTLSITFRLAALPSDRSSTGAILSAAALSVQDSHT